jgi:hypothetical protein
LAHTELASQGGKDSVIGKGCCAKSELAGTDLSELLGIELVDGGMEMPTAAIPRKTAPAKSKTTAKLKTPAKTVLKPPVKKAVAKINRRRLHRPVSIRPKNRRRRLNLQRFGNPRPQRKMTKIVWTRRPDWKEDMPPQRGKKGKKRQAERVGNELRIRKFLQIGHFSTDQDSAVQIIISQLVILTNVTVLSDYHKNRQ